MACHVDESTTNVKKYVARRRSYSWMQEVVVVVSWWKSPRGGVRIFLGCLLSTVVGASACDPPRECATRVRYTGAIDTTMRTAFDIELCRENACASLVLLVDDTLRPVNVETAEIHVGCFLDAPASVLTCWLDELEDGPLGPFQDGERLRLSVKDSDTSEELVSLDFSASYDRTQCFTEIAFP
jgi:hypothetical protein